MDGNAQQVLDLIKSQPGSGARNQAKHALFLLGFAVGFARGDRAGLLLAEGDQVLAGSVESFAPLKSIGGSWFGPFADRPDGVLAVGAETGMIQQRIGHGACLAAGFNCVVSPAGEGKKL